MINYVVIPIAFASKHLSASEKSYTTSKKEALAKVFATKVFNDYIYGNKTIILQPMHYCD